MQVSTIYCMPPVQGVYKGMWCSWLSRSLSMREGSGSIPDMSILFILIARLYSISEGDWTAFALFLSSKPIPRVNTRKCTESRFTFCYMGCRNEHG